MKWFCIVALMSMFVSKFNCDPRIYMSEQEMQDLEKYSAEVDRLFEMMMKSTRSRKPPVSLKSQEDNSDPKSHDYDDYHGLSVLTDIENTNDFDSPLPMFLKPSTGNSSTNLGSESSSSGELSASIECFEDVHHVREIFKQCIYMQSNPSSSTNKPQNSSDDHTNNNFLKYCRRAPVIRSCIKTYIVSLIHGCVDEGVLETLNNVEEVTSAIIRFICRNEADRISLFIADGGIRCLNSRKRIVVFCLSSNIGNMIITSLFDLPSIHIEEDRCDNIVTAQNCVHSQLSTCSDQTLAKVVWVLFDVAKEIASCSVSKDSSQSTHNNNQQQESDEKLTVIGQPLLSNEDKDELQNYVEDQDKNAMKYVNMDTTEINHGNDDTFTSSQFQITSSIAEIKRQEDGYSTDITPSSSISNRIMLSTLILSLLLTLNYY